MARQRLRNKVVIDLHAYLLSVTEGMDREVKQKMLVALAGIVERMSIEDVQSLTEVLRAIKPVHETA